MHTTQWAIDTTVRPGSLGGPVVRPEMLNKMVTGNYSELGKVTYLICHNSSPLLQFHSTNDKNKHNYLERQRPYMKQTHGITLLTLRSWSIKSSILADNFDLCQSIFIISDRHTTRNLLQKMEPCSSSTESSKGAYIANEKNWTKPNRNLSSVTFTSCLRWGFHPTQRTQRNGLTERTQRPMREATAPLTLRRL